MRLRRTRTFRARSRLPVAPVAGLVVAALCAMPATAHADPGPRWSPGDATALLGGGSLGTFTFAEDQTERFGGSGPCPTEGDPDGYPRAAVYTVTTDVASRLMLDVDDDLDGSLSLCRVSVFDGTSGGETLDDLFDEAQRETFLRAEEDGCASDAACSLTVSLPAGGTFYIALWAEPPSGGGGPAESTFTLTGSVKRPVAVRLSIKGHRIKERCYGYYEIVRGRRLTVVARPSVPLDGAFRFRWYDRASDGWRLVGTYLRSISDGSARIVKRVGSGRHLLRVDYVETETAYPSARPYARIRAIVPKARYFSDGGMRLSVRYYRQQHRLSCEAATLRMAHNYFHPGRIDRDIDVYKITGHDKKRRPARTRGCNPDRAFCGNVNGRMMRDGYGVHAGPIARAATVYDRCRPGLLVKDYSYAAIAKHISNGYPVIVWGAHRGASGIYRYRWRAYDGHRVTAWSVEHTWVVYGFRGPASRPTHFLIHDPSRGAKQTVTRSQFRAFKKYFETAVVVRG